MKENIIKATAIYSCGNIYLYYAELADGNWILGDGDFFAIVNENPLKDQDTFDDSCYYEWQQEHLVKEIAETYEIKSVLCDILDVIFEGKTIPEWNNFLESELQIIYSRNR